jgi:predicted nucleic acid-binding protein
MSGNKTILDSNVIIFASKEKIDVEDLFSRYDEFYVSIITYMEVYAFDFQSSEFSWKKSPLRPLRVIHRTASTNFRHSSSCPT